MAAAAARYTAVAVVLHWAIALALVGNGVLGWWMADAIDDPDTQLRAISGFQLHKSLGLTVLALSVLRLVWRLCYPSPPFPASMPRWQQRAARVSHWAFYLLMLGIPLTGWLYVSAQWRDGGPLNVPTLWFGQFEVPHLFGLSRATESLRGLVADNAAESHKTMGWIMAGLLCLHVGAALKHQFLDRDGVLRLMLPGWERGERIRATGILSGVAISGIAAVAVGFALFRAPLGSSAFSDVAELPTRAAVRDTGRWSFGPDHGAVSFSGVHAGLRFNGEFSRWQAQLVFDAGDLAAASLIAEIETGSATDGVPLHDETLLQREWFDVRRHPLAVFRSRSIGAAYDGRYVVAGVLVIKDAELPVSLALDFDAQGAHVNGTFEVERAAANLGMESDPGAEYVSRIITVTVRAAGLPN